MSDIRSQLEKIHSALSMVETDLDAFLDELVEEEEPGTRVEVEEIENLLDDFEHRRDVLGIEDDLLATLRAFCRGAA